MGWAWFALGVVVGGLLLIAGSWAYVWLTRNTR